MFRFDSGISTVIPGQLLLGSALHETDYAMLKEREVTHILQVGQGRRPPLPLALPGKRLPGAHNRGHQQQEGYTAGEVAPGP